MTINSFKNKFNKKQLWYLATVCGFAIGFIIGVAIEDAVFGPRLELFFWAFPASGAGFGMGFGQWILIRRVHKSAYLWIFGTTIGVIVIGGGALLVFAVINYYRAENLSWLYSHLPSWFIPLTIITPIIIFIGPFLQWLMLRHVMKNQSFKTFLKLSMGWILAIIIFFMMFGLLGTLVHSRNEILNYIAGVAALMPSGLIFAYSTKAIINLPQSE